MEDVNYTDNESAPVIGKKRGKRLGMKMDARVIIVKYISGRQLFCATHVAAARLLGIKVGSLRVMLSRGGGVWRGNKFWVWEDKLHR
jgi:hypothetical protein